MMTTTPDLAPARPPGPPAGASPSRDDLETIACPVCQRSFTPAGRQAYCSSRCRKTAYRRRHQGPPAAIIVPDARPAASTASTNAPAAADARWRCDDCGIFGRRIGSGGTCHSCAEPVRISDLLDST